MMGSVNLGSIKQVLFGAVICTLVVNVAIVDFQQINAYFHPKTTVSSVSQTDCDKSCVQQLIQDRVTQIQSGISPTPTNVPQTQSTTVQTENTCDKACVNDLINQSVPVLVNSILAGKPTPTTVPSKTVSLYTPTKVSQTKYIDLPGGTSAGTDWTKVGNSEFWFDASLYGTLTQATWQGWLQVQDSNGSGWVRLYDGTNKRAVDGSQMQITSGNKTSFYSGSLAIWRGQNQYWLEVKSTTGYPVTISGAQMKIVFQ